MDSILVICFTFLVNRNAAVELKSYYSETIPNYGSTGSYSSSIYPGLEFPTGVEYTSAPYGTSPPRIQKIVGTGRMTFHITSDGRYLDFVVAGTAAGVLLGTITQYIYNAETGEIISENTEDLYANEFYEYAGKTVYYFKNSFVIQNF